MKARKNILEWTVFGASALLVGLTVAFLIFEAVRYEGEPPRLEITTGTAVRRGTAYGVQLTIRNSGHQTAEDVRVEVALQEQGRDVETAEVTFAFVPRQSWREGWVLFKNDPRGRTIVVRAIGFHQP